MRNRDPDAISLFDRLFERLIEWLSEVPPEGDETSSRDRYHQQEDPKD